MCMRSTVMCELWLGESPCGVASCLCCVVGTQGESQLAALTHAYTILTLLFAVFTALIVVLASLLAGCL